VDRRWLSPITQGVTVMGHNTTGPPWTVTDTGKHC